MPPGEIYDFLLVFGAPEPRNPQIGKVGKGLMELWAPGTLALALLRVAMMAASGATYLDQP